MKHGNKTNENLVQIALDVFTQKAGYRARIGSNLFLLAGLLFNYSFYKIDDIKNMTGEEDLKRLKRIIGYISENFHEKITLKQISAREHVTYHYLSRFIRDKLGMSFTTFLNRLRLQKAADLLLIGAKTIEQISKEVGFSSANAFHKFFKTSSE